MGAETWITIAGDEHDASYESSFLGRDFTHEIANVLLNRCIGLLFLITASCNLPASSAGKQHVFINHEDGYNLFRIPTIIATNNGKLLAFCEGRNNLFDNGNIDIVMKTSVDNGTTWSNIQVIWNEGNNTCGNPSPVVNKATGDIIVVATLNNDKVVMLRSTDEGSNWDKPKDITASVKSTDWKWYAAGPVHAIQVGNGLYKNRIVIPCNHTVSGSNKHISHVIYSDDNGNTWQLGGSLAAEQTDECTVAEISDGQLLLNMRNSDRDLPNRKISISKDGGITWSIPVFDTALVEPVCQGALLRYSFQPNVLLFSNPKHKKRRKNLTLSISTDNGKSWKKNITICKKPSAYSDLVKLANGDILCIFEAGKGLPYGGIFSAIIKQKDILE
ncbi:MAG TPA: sialidase family protein [Chitinophagales bacterium]|nr:sialidase family protein [Chitinophagales bacterium]